MLIEMKQAKLIQYKTVILLPYFCYMLSIFKTDLSYRILRSFHRPFSLLFKYTPKANVQRSVRIDKNAFCLILRIME